MNIQKIKLERSFFDNLETIDLNLFDAIELSEKLGLLSSVTEHLEAMQTEIQATMKVAQKRLEFWELEAIKELQP